MLPASSLKRYGGAYLQAPPHCVQLNFLCSFDQRRSDVKAALGDKSKLI